MKHIKKVRQYTKFILPEYFIITTLSIIAFSLMLTKTIILTEIIGPILIVTLVMIGLNSINNVSDLEIDRLNKPKRPLVSGKITKKSAVTLGLMAFLLALLIAVSIDLVAIGLTALAILAAISYSVKPFRFKRILLGSNIIGAFIYAVFPYLLMWNVTNGDGSIVFLLFFGGLIFSIAPIKDIEDLKGLKKFGIKSIASSVGIKHTMGLVIFLLLLLNFIMMFLELFGNIELKFLYATIISFLFIFLLTLYYRIKVTLIHKEEVITQSIIVTITMITIMSIELIYGVVNVIC